MPGGGSPRSADQLLALVRDGGLLSDEVVGAGPVLLMCSAGRDSHCLLDVAVRLRGAGGVHVLHVDHGLREGSAADGEQLRARCDRMGVTMVVRRAQARRGPNGAADRAAHQIGSGAEVGEGAGPASVPNNLHAWARGQRLRLAEEERARIGAAFVATAHTRSDLVETALARFATQPGRRALLAMREREERLVRPLLAISREETAAYCRARGITYRDDPTNADARFSRARLRHSVVPVLRSLNPRAEEAITRTLAELAEEGAVIDALVDAELGGERRDGEIGGAAPTIDLARLAALPAPLARLVLRELCERTLGAPCPRAASRLVDVLALAGSAERAGVAAVDVGGGARIEVRGGVVRCARSRGSAAPARRD